MFIIGCVVVFISCSSIQHYASLAAGFLDDNMKSINHVTFVVILLIKPDLFVLVSRLECIFLVLFQC